MGLHEDPRRGKIYGEVQNLISIIIQFFLLLAIAAISHYFLIDTILIPLITTFETMFPTAYNSTVVSLIQSILHYLLLFVILSGSYYVLVSVQRRKAEGYYG